MITLKKFLSISIFMVLIINAFGEPDRSTITTTIHSKILGEDRKVFVRLPHDYDNSKKSYKVFYILDGDMEELLDEAEIAAELNNVKTGFGEYIIVGISTRKNRNRDMIPAYITDRPGSGGGENFLQFITSELQPFIESKYRTDKEKIIFGGSNAGLFTVFAFMTDPSSFDYYISSSTMIGHNEDFMNNQLAKVKEFPNKYAVKHIYFNYGGNDYPRTTKYLPAFYRELSKLLPKSSKHALEYWEEAGHVPEGSIIAGLEFFSE